VIALGFLLGLGGIVYFQYSQRASSELDTGPGEAFAALAGAIVGLGGADIGQATGELRAGRKTLRCDHLRFDMTLGLVAIGAFCGAAWLFTLDHAWSAAAATIVVAAVGVPWVHLRHERIEPRQDWDLLLGHSLVVGVPFLAVAGILVSPKFAEALATGAVALVGIGATLLSHGRALRRQLPQEG
jgi:hypothetical protein